MPAPARSAAVTAAPAAGPAAIRLAGAASSVRSASCLVMSREVTGVMVTPACAARTANSPAGTPSPGTSRTSAGRASATPVTEPLSRYVPAGSPAGPGTIRTVGSGGAPGAVANGTASAAVAVPAP